MTEQGKRELIELLAVIGWIAILILISPIMILIDAVKHAE